MQLALTVLSEFSTVRKSSVRHCVKALHCMDFGGRWRLWHVVFLDCLPELLCQACPASSACNYAGFVKTIGHPKQNL